MSGVRPAWVLSASSFNWVGGHDWFEGPQDATEMTRRHLDLVRRTLGAGHGL